MSEELSTNQKIQAVLNEAGVEVESVRIFGRSCPQFVPKDPPKGNPWGVGQRPLPGADQQAEGGRSAIRDVVTTNSDKGYSPTS